MPLIENASAQRAEGIQAIATRQRRGQILDAAVLAFTERGFDGTSLRDVATRAGISHTGLLHHYPDKVALLEAVLDDRISGASAVYELESRDGERFLRALVKVAEHDVEDSTTIALFTRLSAESASPSHPAHGYFARWYATIRSRLEDAYTDLDGRGLYRSDISPKLAALHTASMRDGLNLQWLLEPNEFDLVGAVRSNFRIYVEVEL
jgi:AcrR family transcriptional regulator